MALNAPKPTPVWPRRLAWACLSLGLTPLILAQAGWAQETTNPLSDFRPNAEQGPGSFSRSSNGLSVFDLIHRARFGNLDMDTFSQEQRQNLDDAAAQFRKQQQQRLGAPQPPAPAQPEPVNSTL